MSSYTEYHTFIICIRVHIYDFYFLLEVLHCNVQVLVNFTEIVRDTCCADDVKAASIFVLLMTYKVENCLICF